MPPQTHGIWPQLGSSRSCPPIRLYTPLLVPTRLFGLHHLTHLPFHLSQPVANFLLLGGDRHHGTEIPPHSGPCDPS